MTEFGATTDSAVVRDAMNAADRAMDSAIYWAYANNAPFRIPAGVGVASPREQGLVLDLGQPLDGANLRIPIWDALVRPYPQAVAGTPLHWGYDPNRRVFDLVYSTARAGDGRSPMTWKLRCSCPAGTSRTATTRPSRAGESSPRPTTRTCE